MKKTLIALTIAASTVAPTLANADTILGLYAGVGQWNAGLGGDIGVKSSPSSFEELGFKDESGNVIWAKFEHPIPLIPNVMLKSTSLTTASSTDITSDINLGFGNISGQIDTELDLSHIDATLYYEILDNWVTLDVGLTARSFSGHFNVDNDGIATDQKFSFPFPLVYLSAQFDLPLTGFRVGLSTQYMSVSDTDITDTSIYAGYSTNLIPLFDVGINVGYRSLSVLSDELDETHVDATFDGAFFELTAHF